MDVTAQLSRVLLLLEQFCLKFNEQKENTTSRYAEESNKYKIKDGFGPDEPSTLSSNERTRWKSIAKIFNSTLAAGVFLSLSTGQDKNSKLTSNVIDVRLVEISKKSLKDLNQVNSKSDSGWFSNLFKGIGAVVGIAALGTAIYFIIKSIGGMPSVDTKTILLVAGGILAFVGILYGLTKIGWGDLLKGLIALGGIAAILNFLIVPAMVQLSSINWKNALGAVIMAGLAIMGLAELAKKLGKAVSTDAKTAILGLTSIAAIAALIQYLIAPAMMAISEVPWDAALGAIIVAGLAITGVALLAEAIGKAVSSNAIAAIVGLTSIAAIAALIQYLIAPAMMAISEVPWDAALAGIEIAGIAITGLAVLAGGIGLIMTTGIGAVAILAGLASIAAIAALIQYLIAPAMMAISEVPWDATLEGIAVAGIAITGFAALAGVIGLIMTTGIGAVALGAGLLALTGLAKVMGYTAENLLKYNKVDPDKLTKSAAAIVILNKALASGIIGSGANFLSTLGDQVSKDPVKYYARFANEINAVNLAAVANSIKLLNEYLHVNLSSNEITKTDYPAYYSRFSNEINAVNLQSVANSIASLHNSLSMPINLVPIKDYIDNYTKLLSGISNPDIFNNLNLNTVVDRIKQFTTAITDSLKGFNFNKLNEIDLSPINNKVNAFITNLRNTLNDPIGIKLNIDSQLNTMLTNLYEQEARILTRQLEQLINNGRKLDIIANNISNSTRPAQMINSSSNDSVISNNFSDTKSAFLKNITLDTSSLAYS